jgi:hypothetical protein
MSQKDMTGRSVKGDSMKRHTLIMETKVDTVQHHERGEKWYTMHTFLRWSVWLLGIILKDNKQIMQCVKGSVPRHSTVISRKRSTSVLTRWRLCSVCCWRTSISVLCLKTLCNSEGPKCSWGSEVGDVVAYETFPASHSQFHRLRLV